MAERSLVRNVGDPEQVKFGARKERDIEAEKRAALLHVMNTEPGRAFLWHTLEGCKVFESIMEQSSRIYYNAGVQDVGHSLRNDMRAASEALYWRMEEEARARATRFNRTVDAQQTEDSDG